MRSVVWVLQLKIVKVPVQNSRQFQCSIQGGPQSSTHELKDAGGDDGLAACSGAGERPLRGRVLQHDAVQLRHVELVALRS
jgi:hypothetical protein